MDARRKLLTVTRRGCLAIRRLRLALRVRGHARRAGAFAQTPNRSSAQGLQERSRLLPQMPPHLPGTSALRGCSAGTQRVLSGYSGYCSKGTQVVRGHSLIRRARVQASPRAVLCATVSSARSALTKSRMASFSTSVSGFACCAALDKNLRFFPNMVTLTLKASPSSKPACRTDSGVLNIRGACESGSRSGVRQRESALVFNTQNLSFEFGKDLENDPVVVVLDGPQEDAWFRRRR